MEHMQVIENKPEEQLLAHIMINYLVNLYCMCVVWSTMDAQYVDSISMSSWDNQIKRNISPNGALNNHQMIWLKYEEQGNNENRMSLDDLVEMGINSGCQAYIVGPHTIIDFLDSFENVRFTAKVRYHLSHIVVLPATNDIPKFGINDIFNHPVVKDIPNILIIKPTESATESSRKTFDLITSQFVTKFNGNDLRKLDTFNSSTGKFTENVSLFPNKFDNLEERFIRLALFNYVPYTLWEEVPPGTGNANSWLKDLNEEKNLFVDGTETILFLEFCAMYNCSLVIAHDDAAEWGVIEDNYTGNGVVGEVALRQADVGISALYLWHNVYQFLDFSMGITRTGITCVVPKPQLLGGWLLPSRPFSGPMWLAILLSFISLTLVLYMVRKVISQFDQNATHSESYDMGTTSLNIFATYVTQSIYSRHSISKKVSEMLVIALAFLINLMIANAYSGGLSSIMTVPNFEAPIDTVPQLANSDSDWGATDDAWIYSISLSEDPVIVRLLSKFHPLPVEVLKNKMQTHQFGFSVERLPYGHYAVGEYIDEDSLNYLHLMKNDIYYEYCVAMSYKTWPFKTYLDLFILRVAESGIQRYWELEMNIKYVNNRIQLGIANLRKADKSGPVALRLDHISGIFILWIIGIVLGIIAFVIEILVYHIKCWKDKRDQLKNNGFF